MKMQLIYMKLMSNQHHTRIKRETGPLSQHVENMDENEGNWKDKFQTREHIF
jgi:hypothetical protein